MANDPLRGCPTCGTSLKEANLGYRDYRWASKYLPGRVAPTDGDFILERKGNVLFIEFKPEGVKPGKGQRMTLTTLERLGLEVWVVNGEGDQTTITRRLPNIDGTITMDCPFEQFRLTEDALGLAVGAWFENGGKR